MKRTKYQKKLQYKNKLENKVNNHNPSYYFITKEKDPRNEREDQYSFYRRHGGSNKQRGHENYIYFEKPEVKYTILKEEQLHGRRLKYAKKFFTKSLRQKNKRTEILLQNNEHHRSGEFWWNID